MSDSKSDTGAVATAKRAPSGIWHRGRGDQAAGSGSCQILLGEQAQSRCLAEARHRSDGRCPAEARHRSATAGVRLEVGHRRTLARHRAVAAAQPTPSGVCPRRRQGIKLQDPAPAGSCLANRARTGVWLKPDTEARRGRPVSDSKSDTDGRSHDTGQLRRRSRRLQGSALAAGEGSSRRIRLLPDPAWRTS